MKQSTSKMAAMSPEDLQTYYELKSIVRDMDRQHKKEAKSSTVRFKSTTKTSNPHQKHRKLSKQGQSQSNNLILVSSPPNRIETSPTPISDYDHIHMP